MECIETIDLKAHASQAVSQVFDTMLALPVDLLEDDVEDLSGGCHIVGSVGIAGSVMGNVNILVSESFARIMTAAMLGMDEDEIEGEEEVKDVLGELCNMVGGDIKSRLCDAGLECGLSIPSITSGSNFYIEPRGWARNERFGFRCNGHLALVEIHMKSAG